MSIELGRINHFALRTTRLEESRRFYIDVLGFGELERPPFAFGGAWLFGGGLQLHLIELPYGRMPEEIDTRENHLAFACEDLAAAEAVLQRHGVVYRWNVVPGRGTNQIFFRDPNGWLIELGKYTGPDRSQ